MTPDEEKRAAARERQRKSRAIRRAKAAGEMAAVRPIHAVPTDPSPPSASDAGPSVLDDLPGPGEHERAVRAELDGYGDLTATECPGQASNAIAMARILDNPLALVHHASAGGQLRAALVVLREASKASRSKSSKVRMLRTKHVG